MITQLLLLALVADAGQTVLRWREPIWITWEGSCPAPDIALITSELDDFAARALVDLEGLATPRLGDKFLPYRIRLMPNPGCPGKAPACGDKKTRWRTMKIACHERAGMLSIGHEPFHAGCMYFARIVEALHGRPAAKVCEYADHHIRNDRHLPVLDILGRPRLR